jgi:hypothetical protein
MMLAGCGSGSGTAPEPSTGSAGKSAGAPTTTSSKDPCEPRPFSDDVEGPLKVVNEGEDATIEIGMTKVSLKLTGASSPATIPVAFEPGRTFKAPPGSMLVAVAYKLRNRGPGEIKPSTDLNSRTLLKLDDVFYPYASALPCDIPISASWAVAHGGTNPAIPLPAHGSTETAVVFIVPKPAQKTRIALVVPGQVGIELRKLDS